VRSLEWVVEQLRADGRVLDVTSLRRVAGLHLRKALTASLKVVTWNDPTYPTLLSTVCDCPPVLWMRGDVAAFADRAVAIVGSRDASPYGLQVATRLAFDLAGRGVTVISGLARGVDSAAHRGALEAGGCTVAVLGSGADVIYPPEHAELASRIIERGAVASELPPGSRPLPRHFPARNRIISGLARVVVVVEAAERSGSLGTARWALDQGRDVMAVPGSVLSTRHRGSHALIRDGAKIVETVDDILEELPLGTEGLVPPTRTPGQPSADPVWRVLGDGEPQDLDTLARATGLERPALLARLTELEVAGAVERAAGGGFVRSGRYVVIT
jgi:DNA processing protein